MPAEYTEQQIQEIVDFISAYDIENGRGGQTAAKKKFGISPITLKK